VRIISQRDSIASEILVAKTELSDTYTQPSSTTPCCRMPPPRDRDIAQKTNIVDLADSGGCDCAYIRGPFRSHRWHFIPGTWV